MKNIKVGLEKNSYEVIVGTNLINRENLAVLKDKEVLLVLDENIPLKYKELITEEEHCLVAILGFV